MRIVYIAHGIPVPGTLGGSTHAYEVARGLARRGHEVHLLASSREGWESASHALQTPFLHVQSVSAPPVSDFYLYHLDVPKLFTPMVGHTVARWVQAMQPDALIERYYNMAGYGIRVAHHMGIPTILEVNALIVDPPDVGKRRLDTALGSPLRRRAVVQCQLADVIITPLHTTVPEEIDRAKVVELPWGANTERFAVVEQLPFTGNLRPTAVFLGAFRVWHGATDFVRAGVRLLSMGNDYSFMLIGDGPERRQAEAIASEWRSRFTFTGTVPYEEVPHRLARATVGVAPFTTRDTPALKAGGFFWSPLKVYEYMAASLPVVTTDIPPLDQIIRNGHEGYRFREDDLDDLSAAMLKVLHDTAAARRMGARARERVVMHYSWQQHCTELERLLYQLRLDKRPTPPGDPA